MPDCPALPTAGSTLGRFSWCPSPDRRTHLRVAFDLVGRDTIRVTGAFRRVRAPLLADFPPTPALCPHGNPAAAGRGTSARVSLR